MIPQMVRLMFCEKCQQETKHRIQSKHTYNSSAGIKMIVIKKCIKCFPKEDNLDYELETIPIKNYYELVNTVLL